MAKSRWEIENEGFHEAKSRHGLEHICHHHANSLLIGWLLTMLAMTIEQLYRCGIFAGANLPHVWINLFRPYPPTAVETTLKRATFLRATGFDFFATSRGPRAQPARDVSTRKIAHLPSAGLAR